MKGEDSKRYRRWLLLSAILLLAKFSTSAQTLRSLVQDLEAHPDGHGPKWAAELDAPITRPHFLTYRTSSRQWLG